MSLPKEAQMAKESSRKPGLFRCPDESLCGISWLVAIASCFFVVGVVGMIVFDVPLSITLSGRAGMGAVDNESTDMSMADLQAMEEAPQVNPTEEVVEETLEVPDPIEMSLELQELPEVTEALVTEDVFTVPAAPKIETALKPVDPAKPKPKPQSKPVNAKPRSSRATGTVATTNGTNGSGGGGGGNGRVGAGGKGKFPKPSYPSGARSRKVSGSLTFRLRISAAGAVESASVVSSNCSNGGFTAAEQSQISSFICRTWRFPEGMMGTKTLPLRFDLR